MAAAQILTAISIIFMSFVVGISAFYYTSDLSKTLKKKHIAEITSQLVNFVIFIWVGKIVLNLPVLIKDPLAILAYPSNAQAFYLAVLFSTLTLAYKHVRRKMDVTSLINAFLPVFLIASFVYEFTQFFWSNDRYAIGYIALLAVLLVVYLFTYNHIKATTLTIMMVIGWSTGKLVLTFILPFTTVFGYIMEPWFLGLFFITSVLLLIFRLRKKVL